MKKQIKVIMCSVSLIMSMLTVASCNEKPQSTNTNPSADTAGGFDYKCRLDQMNFPEEVSLYQADYWKATDYDLEADLLKGIIIDHEVWAEGPQTITQYKKSNEYLTFYDDGESFFGKKGNSIDGGFKYSDASAGDWYSEKSIAELKWDLCGPMSGVVSDIQNIQSWGNEELSFCSLKDEKDTLLKQFQKWDLDMQLLENYTIKISSKQNGYLLMFTELIDEIPLMPYFYTEGDTRYNDWLLNCHAYAYVSEEGVIKMEFANIVQPIQKMEKIKIISFKEAKEKMEEYLKKKYINKVTIEDIGLYYIGIPNSEESGYVLTPFWFFCVSSEAWNAEEKTEMPTNVFYELLNATNGEWLYH